MHLITVCLGNICRSPAAEAMLAAALDRAGLTDVTVASAGTADYHVGERPHRISIAEGESRGLEFTSRGAQFDSSDFDGADLILVMDSANEEDVLAQVRTPQDAAKVVRIGAFAPDIEETGVLDVPDPWGQSRAAFARMYDQLEPAVAGLVQALADGSVTERVASVSPRGRLARADDREHQAAGGGQDPAS